MSNEYFNLIDTEEKILWVIKEYGIEAMELVLDNLREECSDMYKKLEIGMKTIHLTEKVIKEYKDSNSTQDKTIIDISEYFKNNYEFNKSFKTNTNPINQNVFIFPKGDK